MESVKRAGLILAVAGAHAAAQSGTSPSVKCDGRTVTSIVITPRDPSFLAVPRQLREVARGVGLLHTTSTQETIGRFLLLSIGQPCSERQRAESERILRLQPFLADAFRLYRLTSEGAVMGESLSHYRRITTGMPELTSADPIEDAPSTKRYSGVSRSRPARLLPLLVPRRRSTQRE